MAVFGDRLDELFVFRAVFLDGQRLQDGRVAALVCRPGASSRMTPPPMVSSGERKRTTKRSPGLAASGSVRRS
jgi:hypothetical protein